MEILQDNNINQTESQDIKPVIQDDSRNPDGTFKPGFSGNLNGRPKSKSIKELVRDHLEQHPEDMAKFVAYFVEKDRSLAWQMLEGKPPQDITSGGDKINPIPIYGGLSSEDGLNQKGDA